MRLYHAKEGQTLSQIAQETGCTYEALKEANPSLHASRFRQAQTILLPQQKRYATIERGEAIPAFCQRLHIRERSLLQMNLQMPRSGGKAVVDTGCSAHSSILVCGSGTPYLQGSTLANTLSHLTFYEVDGLREWKDGYVLPNMGRTVQTLKRNGVTALVRLPLLFHLNVTEKLCESIARGGFGGVVVHPPHFDTQALPLIRGCLKQLQEASLITCLALPCQKVADVQFLLSQFEGLAHYFFLDLSPACDVLATLEDLTDATTQRERFHILLGCQAMEKSHVMEHGFLDTLLAAFDRLAYGRFAGIHFSLEKMPQEFYTCLTGSFHLQGGYETDLPHSLV